MRLFYEFKCTVLVKLGRAIPDQVCSVHEILPLWSRTDQWTVKYNLLYGKINLDRILWRNGSMQFGCFIQNPVKDTWAALLCELFRIESTVYFSKKFACYDHEVISELSSTILWRRKSNWIEFCDIIVSMQFGFLIQNPVQDTWAALIWELFRIERTVYFSQNLLWTRSSASLCCNTFGFVLGLSLCCVSENAAFMSSNDTVLVKLSRTILD